MNESHASLYDAAPCGLLTTSANGLIRHANQTFCRWIGIPLDELLDKVRLQDLLTVGCKIFHQTHWLPLLQIQGSVGEVQLELVQRGGHVLSVLVNAQQREQLDEIFHDIAVFIATDRKKYEHELLLARRRAEELLESERKAQDAAQDALRLLEQAAQQRAVLAEQLVGIVSHDLRSPLNVMVLGAGMLAASEGMPAAAHGRTVNRVISAGKRATRLVDDLLDFTQTRLGSGLSVQIGAFDLHELVAECVDELKLVWTGRMLEHTRVGAGLVDADSGRLAQVVTNLVSNAMTYGAPERPITITSAIDAASFRISVRNDGPSIPADLLPHIFEPLRRGEQQVKLGSRSVGLGLYIVHQIALAHGGTVSVESNAEHGTTFTVMAPMGVRLGLPTLER